MIRAVTHAHLVRAIHLASALLRLREHVAGFAFIRSLCEAHINVHYILCELAQQATRAQDFHDFFDVNKLRILSEIARRFPHLVQQINPGQVAQQLNALKPRFYHQPTNGTPYWDWDKRNVIARAQHFAKVRATSKAERESLERIIALYQEANPHVHGGMFSTADTMEFDANGTPIRPKLRLDWIGRFLSVLAAQMLLEIVRESAPVLGTSGIAESIETAARKNAQAVEKCS